MPIPKPTGGENETEFMQRCMSDSNLLDEYDNEQRAAICYTSWEENNKTMNNQYELKAAQEIKDLDSAKREVAIYLAKFGNVDSDNDVIQKGAFKKS